MKTKIVLTFFLLALTFKAGTRAEMNLNNAQAIFIYNFLSHINWPHNAIGEKYIIGVLGKTATFDYLRSYTQARKVGTKAIEVVNYNTPNDVRMCNILLVTTKNSSSISTINSKLNGRGCLIVGEEEGSTKSGASIDFNLVDGKLRYKIDEMHVKAQNLEISSTLVRMSL